MSHASTYVPGGAISRWMDERLPIMRLMHDSFVDFPTPKNLNYFYTFGGILTFCLVVQIVSGITLAMHYTADTALAFQSVEKIMRDVNYGWLIRYIHAVGASMFFLAVYLHIARGLYYGSYKAPREVLWILGVIILVLMMAAAFLGYVLPWGQMSFWGATVITNLFSAIPFVGESLVQWLWGGFSVDNPTLTRFFSLHYLVPFIIFGVVVLHIWALHVPGNNNPTGIDVKNTAQDTVPFHPYYTVKDAFALIVFVMLFAWFVFWEPNILGHSDNYIPADPLVTPAEIVPEWYLLPFYAILRAIPDKLGGVIAMFAAIGILVVIPWLDTSKVRSLRYRPLMRPIFFLFVLVCLGLGWAGAQPADKAVFKWTSDTNYVVVQSEDNPQRIAYASPEEKQQIVDNLRGAPYTSETVKGAAFSVADMCLLLTILYFAYFLVAMPVIGWIEKPLARPSSIAESVLSKSHAKTEA